MAATSPTRRRDSTGALLWRNGGRVSDISVVVRGDGGATTTVALHAVVLAHASTFFGARLSATWASREGDTREAPTTDTSPTTNGSTASTATPTPTTAENGGGDSKSQVIVFDSPVSVQVSLLALELLYTAEFDERVKDIPTAIDLLKTFNFLGADHALEWTCRCEFLTIIYEWSFQKHPYIIIQ